MNLKEIREAVERELVFDPDIESHRKDLNSLINSAYMELLAERRWKFQQKIHRLPLYKDISIGRVDVTGVDEHTIKFARSFMPDTIAAHLEGHIIELSTSKYDPDGRDVSMPDLGEVLDTATSASKQHLIERAYVTGSDLYLKLDPTFKGADGSYAGGDLTIKFYRYKMPHDFSECLGMMSRDDNKGELRPMDLSMERKYMLNPDETGDPVTYLSEVVSPSEFFNSPGGPSSDTEGYARFSIQPMLTEMALADSSTGGYITPGTRCQYFAVWHYAGVYSPPGPVVEITTAAGTNTNKVTITNIEALHQGDTGASLGRERHLYRRYGEQGPWQLMAVSLDPAVTTAVDIGVIPGEPKTNEWHGQYVDRRWENVHRGSSYEFVRFWPRPSANKVVDMRYMARAKYMHTDYEEPNVPLEYHRILVHRVVANLAIRHEATNLFKVHDRMGDKLFQMMKRRYGSETAAFRQRRSFTANPPHSMYVPTIDYVP